MKLKTYNTFEDLLTEQVTEGTVGHEKTIGIFPGAFKPPHRGHYLTANEACRVCDVVYILMSGGGRELGKASKSSSVPEWKKYEGILPGGKFIDKLPNLNIELAEVDRATSASAMRAKIADFGLTQNDTETFLDNIDEFLPDIDQNDKLTISDQLIGTIANGVITAVESSVIWEIYIRNLEVSNPSCDVNFAIINGSPITNTYELVEGLNKDAQSLDRGYNILLYTGE